MISVYNEMWDKVKKLSLEQQKSWLTTITPCKGRNINFFDIQVVDIDLAEALRFMIEDAI